jgi:hypothetical protein
MSGTEKELTEVKVLRFKDPYDNYHIALVTDVWISKIDAKTEEKLV